VTRSRRRREAGFTMIEAGVGLPGVGTVFGSVGSPIALAPNRARALGERVSLSGTLRFGFAPSPPLGQPGCAEQSSLRSGFAWRRAIFPFVDQDAIASPSIWIPVRVVIQVRAPSGAVSSVETIQLVKRPPG